MKSARSSFRSDGDLRAQNAAYESDGELLDEEVIFEGKSYSTYGLMVMLAKRGKEANQHSSKAAKNERQDHE